MLSFFRALSATWPARLFFLALAAVFVIWGISSRSQFGGNAHAAATVAGTTITIPELQQTYRKLLDQAQRQMGGKGELPPAMRQQVAMDSMQQLVTQAALQGEVRRLGLAIPDQAILQAARAIPAFRDPQGNYDPAVMRRVLQANNLTEQSFIELLRKDVGQGAILGAVTAGATAAPSMSDAIYTLQRETRTADAVEFRFADAPTPATPNEAALHRWYDNHPKRYTSPEYRRIRAVILDPATIEKEVPVSDSDLRAAYEKRKAEFSEPERRSVQVLTMPAEAAAGTLAAAWRTGRNWPTIQAQAKAAGGTATELTAAT